MKFKNQYSDIYGKIQNDTKADLPESLQPAAIADLVKGKEIAPRKRHIATFASLAAAVVLVLAGVVGWRLLYDAPKASKPIEPPQQAAMADADDAYLHSATDYKEIEDYFAEKHAAMRKNNLYNGTTDDSYVEETAGSAAGIGSDSSSQEIAYGVTNTQVENIDEGDILKNDGNYLYFLHREKNDDNICLEIIDIRNRNELPVVAKLTPPAPEEGKRAVAEELYVYDNTLVMLYTVRKEYVQTNGYKERLYAYDAICEYMQTATAAAVYDITDRTAPVLTNTYAVDGALLASRMDGTKLILSTNYSVPLYQNEENLKNSCVPCYYTEDQKVRFAVNDVKFPAETDDTGYCTVSILDTADASAQPQMKAILGVDCQTVYCNGDTLLATRVEWDIESFDDGTVTASNAHTRLYVFSLTDGIVYKGSAAVAGTTLNQFSLDAYNGYYRIATCENAKGSRVTVFNESLELVGEISGIAEGENIYAVRFMGDTAYMVTFLQTDPLFVLDLSDPKNPAVTGELEIPGFSNYLHPYKENLLIGIGSEQTDSESYVKISLFDVSDKQNPQEISKLLCSQSTSEAQYDHKAYTALRDTDEFALPITQYSENSADNVAITVAVENGELQITHTYVPQEDGNENDPFPGIRRVTYRENVIYTLTDSTLTAFSRDTGEVLCTYRFYTPETEVVQ